MTLYLGNNLVSGVAYPTEPTRNLGQIIESIIPLQDAGLHLLDGALINGSGLYSAFVDEIGKIYNNTTTFLSNIVKVGSLIDNDCVLSGFSASIYGTLPSSFRPLNNTWEQHWKVTTSSDLSVQYFSGEGNVDYQKPAIGIGSNQHFVVWISSTGTSWNIASNVLGSHTVLANTTYYIKYGWNGTEYYVEYSFDDKTYTRDITVYSTVPIVDNSTVSRVGLSYLAEYWRGSIDLKESYIDIGGSRWWTGTTPTGFTDESSWQASVTTYGVCGKFVYDSVANTVRLPKITGKLDGTTDVTALGDLVAQYIKLPNITGSIDCPLAGPTSGAFVSGSQTSYQVSGGTGGKFKNSTFDASRSSSVYSGNGTDTKIHEQAINVLYYIVIATTTKTDIEVDIDEVATDLNSKCDVDGTNATFPHVVETYINDRSGYIVYSNGLCEQWGYTRNSGNTIGVAYTVILLKNYKDNKYNITMFSGVGDSGWQYANGIGLGVSGSDNNSADTYVTTSSFIYFNCTGINGTPIFWRTIGYIS